MNNTLCHEKTQRIHFSKIDDVWMRVDVSDDGILYELSEYLSFYVEGAEFSPAFKNNLWDGVIRLFDYSSQKTYLGLIDVVLQFALDRGYDVTGQEYILPRITLPETLISDYLETLKITDRDGNPITPHEFQITALEEFLSQKRNIFLSPTGTGKSLISYLICRSLFDLNEIAGKILILTSTQGLVDQMYSDFGEYSQNDDNFEIDAMATRIHSKAVEKKDVPLVISTWQSVYKRSEDYFRQFDAVIVDECHLAKANSIKSILEKCKTCEYKVGITATLSNTPTHEYVLTGLFGPAKTLTTIEEAQKNKILSDLEVSIVEFQYSKEERKKMSYSRYHDEKEWVCSHEKRNSFITQLANSLSGNTLILVEWTEKHGNQIWERMNKDIKDKEIFYVHGGVKDREEIRKHVADNTNCVILATYGTFQLGINIPNLENIIFAMTGKSMIRVFQSIGRGLRVSKGKNVARVFDLVDDLKYKKYVNYSLQHFAKRYPMYMEKKFKVSGIKVDISKMLE